MLRANDYGPWGYAYGGQGCPDHSQAARSRGCKNNADEGNDLIPCFSFADTLDLFGKDPETKTVIAIGEVDGAGEIEAVKYIQEKINKRAFALFSALNAPLGKKMGDAGPIVLGKRTTAWATIFEYRDAKRYTVWPFNLLREKIWLISNSYFFPLEGIISEFPSRLYLGLLSYTA